MLPYYDSTNKAYTIPCGSSTANLSGITATNNPNNRPITWHTETPATDANKVANPALIPGATAKYYASFWKSDSNCYSPTRLVTVYTPICADTDDYTAMPVYFGAGPVLPSLFLNDTYNAAGFTMPNSNIEFIYEYWNTSWATVNANGTIQVSPTLPVGTYTFYYKIIDKDPDAVPGSNSSIGEVIIKVIAPLPISLLKFDAAAQSNGVMLTWATATEHNNNGFVVERSNDGRNWAQAGFVASAAVAGGNSTEGLAYSYMDERAASGTNYYRLKEIDINGTFTYSAVTSAVVKTSKKSISLYPNPTKQAVTVNGLQAGDLLRVYDIAGRIIDTQNMSSATASISLADVPEGVYFLQVNSADGVVHTEKIVKIK